jgi:hypothetical protein
LLLAGVPAAVRVVRRAALPPVVPYVRSGAGGVKQHERRLGYVTLAAIGLIAVLARFASLPVLYAVIGVAAVLYIGGLVFLLREVSRAPDEVDEYCAWADDELDRRASVRHTIGGGTRG